MVLAFVVFSGSLRLRLTCQRRPDCGSGPIHFGSKRRSCSTPRNCGERLQQVRAATLEFSEVDRHSPGLFPDNLSTGQLHCFYSGSNSGFPDLRSSKPQRTVTYPLGFPITARVTCHEPFFDQSCSERGVSMQNRGSHAQMSHSSAWHVCRALLLMTMTVLA